MSSREAGSPSSNASNGARSTSLTDQLAKIQSLLNSQISLLQENDARLKSLHGDGSSGTRTQDSSQGSKDAQPKQTEPDPMLSKLDAQVDQMLKEQNEEAKKWIAERQQEREATKDVVKDLDKSHSDRIAQLHAIAEELRADRDRARAELDEIVNQRWA